MLILDKWKQLLIHETTVWLSGAEFQKGMDTVLGDLTQNFVTIYIDDILITSGSLEEHYNHIKTVMQRFSDYNITVNLEKC